MARQLLNRGDFPDDAGADNIYTGVGQLNDMTGELYDLRPHYVTDYGAVGDSSYQTGGGTDDTAAIQAAIDAAATSGGRARVVFPGRRAYRISSTLNVPPGLHMVGIGGIDNSGTMSPVVLVWNGADLGTIVQVAAASGYINMTYFEGLNFRSADNLSNKAGTGVKFIGTPGYAQTDSGTGFRNCFFQAINGNGLHFQNCGSTNFFLEGGRFDSVYGGYGIYVDLNSTSPPTTFVGAIYGNTNWVGGNNGQGKGFLFLDGESGVTGSYSFVRISGLHTEVNQNLDETYAGGANPYDRRGVIRLGCNTSVANLQHMVRVDGWFNGFSGGLNSYSSIQLTATGGTDAEVSDCVYVSLDMGNALTAGVTESGATDEVRLFGGRVPAVRKYPYSGSVRTSGVRWGYGKNTTGDGMRSFSLQRHGSNAVSGLTLVPETVATLDQFPIIAGGMAYVTDATSTTLGSTVAGGGANKVLVMHNGTAWKIIAVVN